jgi:uncharacterized membrane protein YgaE (UPF0421/DUF939 family)
MTEPAAEISLSIYHVLVLVGALISAFWVLHMAIVNHKLKSLREKVESIENNTFSKLDEVNKGLETINSTVTQVHTLYHDLDKQVAVAQATKERGKNA